MARRQHRAAKAPGSAQQLLGPEWQSWRASADSLLARATSRPFALSYPTAALSERLVSAHILRRRRRRAALSNSHLRR